MPRVKVTEPVTGTVVEVDDKSVQARTWREAPSDRTPRAPVKKAAPKSDK